MTTERTVFFMEPPADQDSKYILMLAPVGGEGLLLGGRVSTLLLSVDSLDIYSPEGAHVELFRGMRGKERVVEFPAGTPYLLIARSMIRFLTPGDAYVREQAARDEYQAVVTSIGKEPGKEPSETPVATENLLPGQYL